MVKSDERRSVSDRAWICFDASRRCDGTGATLDAHLSVKTEVFDWKIFQVNPFARHKNIFAVIRGLRVNSNIDKNLSEETTR